MKRNRIILYLFALFILSFNQTTYSCPYQPFELAVTRTTPTRAVPGGVRSEPTDLQNIYTNAPFQVNDKFASISLKEKFGYFEVLLKNEPSLLNNFSFALNQNAKFKSNFASIYLRYLCLS